MATTDATPDLDREALDRALAVPSGIVDLTTWGRRSGKPHRIEIAFFNFDGHLFITGTPGRRDWYANLGADPRLIFHVKRGASADIPAHARLVTDAAERRSLLERVVRHWRREAELERFISESPLIEVIPDDASLLAR